MFNIKIVISNCRELYRLSCLNIKCEFICTLQKFNRYQIQIISFVIIFDSIDCLSISMSIYFIFSLAKKGRILLYSTDSLLYLRDSSTYTTVHEKWAVSKFPNWIVTNDYTKHSIPTYKFDLCQNIWQCVFFSVSIMHISNVSKLLWLKIYIKKDR